MEMIGTKFLTAFLLSIFILSTAEAECQTIDIYYKKEKTESFYIPDEESVKAGAPGSQLIGNDPFYSSQTGKKIGQLRFLVTYIAGKKSSEREGSPYIGTNVMTMNDGSGQLSYVSDDFSQDKKPHQYIITGGSGKYACAGGVIRLIGDDEDKIYRQIEVCSNCEM